MLPANYNPLSGQRIAIISHTHPSVTKGGAEVSAYALYSGLRALGTDAIFIAACPSSDRSRLTLASEDEFVIFVEPGRYEHFYQIGDSATLQRLRDVLISERITIANFHHFLNFGVNTLRMAKTLRDGTNPVTAGLKIVLTLHEFLAICHHHGQMVTKPARQLCQSATPQNCAICFPEHTPSQFEQRREFLLASLGGLTGYISPSRFLASRMTDWGLPGERIAVIENGLRKIPEALTPRAPRVPGSPFVFGYFGQITPFKGVDTLLDAVDLIARQTSSYSAAIEVRIHGNLVGQTEAFMKRFNEALGQHSFLTYVGAYNNANVVPLMRECDYVLVPSTWWENSPVVIQEAFLAGCPVICSGIGGMAEKVIDGVYGLHTKVGSRSDLARVIRQAADESTYATLTAALPRVIDQAEMAEQYIVTLRDWTEDIEPVTLGSGTITQ